MNIFHTPLTSTTTSIDDDLELKSNLLINGNIQQQQQQQQQQNFDDKYLTFINQYDQQQFNYHQQQNYSLINNNIVDHTNNYSINNNNYHHQQQQEQQELIIMNGQQHQHNYNKQQRNPFIGRSQCVVCNDRARGCNFNAITCASCKEFFRRNAFKRKKLKCYFQNKCEINIHSRRFCAACRLEKCYIMGMKNEYIMSESEKYERNLKINERKLLLSNRKNQLQQQRKQQQRQQNYSIDNLLLLNENIINNHHNNYQNNNNNRLFDEIIYDDDSLTTINNNNNNNENNNNNYIDNNDNNIEIINNNQENNLIINYQNFKSTSSSSNDIIEINDNDEEIIIDKKEIDKQNMAEEKLIKLMNKIKIVRESGYSVAKFHLLLRAASSNVNRLSVLNKHDSCRLKYLTSIVQILSAETISDLPTDQKFIDLIRIAEIVTFNFIKMCKKLYSFQELNQEDQVALVKGGVMDTLLIWSMMTINLEKECWEALDLQRNLRFTLKLEKLKQTNPKLYDKHHCYVMSFEPEWRYNENLMSLLIAIALFNPDCPNLYNKQKIRQERNSYCNLMKQYLDTLYEEPTISQEMYDRLINQLKLTEKISEYHMKTYFDINTNDDGYNGLFIQIDDLNNITNLKTKCC